MPPTWTLLDLDRDVDEEQLSIMPDPILAPGHGYSVVKRRLHGGRREGVDIVTVDNGRCRFVVVPTRGMGIHTADVGSVHLGWKSPVKGPVHPSFVPMSEAGGLGWLDGFDEHLCRCGLENNGAPVFNPNGTLKYPLHGKIANQPAHKVDVVVDEDAGRIVVHGEVDEARLFFNKLRLRTSIATDFGQPGYTLTDTVVNLSAEAAHFQLLYHINFGQPLAAPGAKVVLPVARMAPRDATAAADVDTWDTYGPETPGLGESVFFFDLAADGEGRTAALLRSADGASGVGLRFNKRELPCFTLWKNRQAAADGYVTGLEPAINYPNPRDFEEAQGRVAVLQPGESRTFSVEVAVLTTAAEVAAAEAAIAALQTRARAEILRAPTPAWSRG